MPFHVGLGVVDSRRQRRLQGIEARFQSIEARFQSIEARVQAIEARFHGIEARVHRGPEPPNLIPQRVNRVERFRIHPAADRSIVAARSTVTATSIRVQSTRPIFATAPDDRVTETATLPGERPNHASRLLLLNCEPQPQTPLELRQSRTPTSEY